MDSETWEATLANLYSQSDFALILSRCLGVVPEISAWRATGDTTQGLQASTALDQAAGMLERLISGDAESLLASVRAILEELPPTIFD